jgi:hypothetical protein
MVCNGRRLAGRGGRERLSAACGAAGRVPAREAPKEPASVENESRPPHEQSEGVGSSASLRTKLARAERRGGFSFCAATLVAFRHRRLNFHGLAVAQHLEIGHVADLQER